MNLGIYVQVPFCQAKCTYCNFHTGVFSKSLYAPYVDAICRELTDHASLYQGAGLEWPGQNAPSVIVDTLYVGGGTPSLLDPGALVCMLQTVRHNFACALEEVTLEADPETVTAAKAVAWRAAGFNRMSLGVQSFHDVELTAAGRRHRRSDIFSAVRRLRGAGFRNLSFDLIAGLPHQTAASWETTLEELLGLVCAETDDGRSVPEVHHPSSRSRSTVCKKYMRALVPSHSREELSTVVLAS